MSKSKAVVIGKLDNNLMEKLQEQCELNVWDKPSRIPQELLLDWLKDAEGLISRGDIKIDDDLLSHAPALRVIAQSSVGFDNVDITACTKYSIPFGNTPGVLVEATADLTFGLMLSSARRIHEGWEYVKAGKWDSPFNIPLGVDLYGKTLGIVGMGNIGRSVAKRAQASGMNIIYHNRSPREENEKIGAKYASFEGLLEESDFIIVLVPLSEQSRHLFGREEFSKMKPTSYFVNASRGAVVDTVALYEALVNKEIAYAALDVTDPEPINTDNPIMSLQNILITPHIGSATHETRMKMASLTIDNLLAGLNRKSLLTCVNSNVNY
ncbi:2-hydroxyacid dehydrogenase [Oceanobacillus alkalisoli]|uniref:2-hydroxyacid dehydrogenase n=1 Tax=Oceanobacillus alkalisoli TaxID=2925113 RepID=UPI001EE4CE44|nr:D-glycerate dehydrogenase [Oceanobacillus alkalisoli]MCG5103219.1 D-glycerate dehydrogenase [Oceanobacillus alkalisoli]